MSEVRSRLAGRFRAADGVTSGALLGKECLPARGNLLFGALLGGLPLPRNPLVELRLLFGDDDKRHVGMLHTAELGALPAIDSGSFRADFKFVRPSRNQILLAGKTRHPE